MNRRLLILFLVGVCVVVPAVYADCCLPGFFDEPESVGNPGYYSCYDSAESEIPGGITEEVCDSFNGQWQPGVSCDEAEPLGACADTCCCLETGSLVVDSFICQQYSGTEHAGYVNDLECEDLCSGDIPPETINHTLTGTVYDFTGTIITPATVRIIELDQEEGEFETNGQFSISLEEGVYTVRATTDECAGSYNNLMLNQDRDIEINLTQCEDNPVEPDCVPQQWDCTWTDEDNQCGWASACVPLIDEEDNPCSYPSQPVYSPCPPPEGCDNDNLAEPGEQCDGTDLREQTCQSRGFFSGDLACTNSCTFDLSDCSVCPLGNPASSCDAEQCAACDNCPASSCPQDTCEDYNPSLDSLEAIPESDQVSLTWTYPFTDCRNSIDSAMVQRCRGVGGSCDPTLDAINMSYDEGNDGWATENFIDSGLDANQEYCYQVFTRLDVDIDGDDIPDNQVIIKLEEQDFCITTGDEECMQEHSQELCTTADAISGYAGGPNVRAHCTDDNNLRILDYDSAKFKQPPYDCGEDVCIGPNTDEVTRCGQSDLCELCNSVYGAYSYYGALQVPFYNDNGVEYHQCSNSLVRAFCFEEKTSTVADVDESCGEVSSCYDYHSKDNCEGDNANPCDIQGLDTCEWKPIGNGNTLLGNEIGLGVCRPSIENQSQWDCSRCNRDDHLAPECTQSLCQLYGSCYYSTGEESPPFNNAGQCWDASDLGCAAYVTEDECIGVDPAQNVSINADYGVTGRIGGTHVLTPSNDARDFGTCMWTGSKCIKDADGFHNDNSFTDDCNANSGDWQKCFRDNQAPVTTVQLREGEDGNPPIYGAQEGLSFNYFVEDNEYEEGIVTKFALSPNNNYWAALSSFPAPERYGPLLSGNEACSELGGSCNGTYCYAYGDGEWNCFDLSNPSFICDYSPSAIPGSAYHDAHALDLSELTQLITAMDSGAWRTGCVAPTQAEYPTLTREELLAAGLPSATYSLRFYSEDPSHNLEVVQELPIEIDGTAPQLIDYNVDQTHYNLSEDDWYTNIHISYDLEEPNGPSHCIGTLTPIGLEADVSDGDMDSIGTAFDQYYNDLRDGSYKHSLYCEDIFGNDAVYNHTILVDGDRSITRPRPFMKAFASTEVNISLETASEATCYWSYDSLTPLTDPNRHQFDRAENGTYHDSIITVPEANMTYVLKTGCQFDNGHQVQASFGDLIIFAIDQIPPNTTLIDEDTDQPYEPDGIYVMERSFHIDCDDTDIRLGVGDQPINLGEKEALYCIGDTPRSCELEHAEDEIHIHSQIDSVDNDYQIFYTCVDNGDNMAEVQSAPLLVRDTTFDPPDVIVCDPEETNPDDEDYCGN